ncbi:MAG: histidine kinase [Polaromonas sp.]|uniref:sensor histidine kinase n=1 Tax=Polaromonas sp. TaxID=1869339 RepID=UPI00272803F1|nr:histidine kinase [Polaromonas sp.]MDO9112230.1 histidine kinase [Polaromonas sp.]MDP1887045.1 histidine kinase [Polaromonas sp.]
MQFKPDLSSFGESTVLGGYSQPGDVSAPQPARVNVFDACNVGVVLRAVLFVEAVVGVGAMFGAGAFVDWLLRFSLLTGGVLPATLAWLIAACMLKGRLARLGTTQQWVAGVALGALAGLYGCGLLVLMNLLNPAPWWASAAAGALLSAVLVAGLVWRAKARTPAATAARLAELQSRIRPHFLFNTLNSAIALVRAEPAKAEAVLEDLSELFRHALADQGEAVTLGQEIALARRYMAIEQIRFGDRLQVQWNLDPDADPAKLPPLLLQPLVENAVRHGVEPSAQGAQIKITTERRGGVVVLKVTNSTPAGVGERGHGLALANVRERLALLHDVQAQFKTVFKDGVFQVRLEIPL